MPLLGSNGPLGQPKVHRIGPVGTIVAALAVIPLALIALVTLVVAMLLVPGARRGVRVWRFGGVPGDAGAPGAVHDDANDPALDATSGETFGASADAAPGEPASDTSTPGKDGKGGKRSYAEIVEAWPLLLAGALLAAALSPSAAHAKLLVPMDDSQTNHLKAYGLTFWVLERQFGVAPHAAAAARDQRRRLGAPARRAQAARDLEQHVRAPLAGRHVGERARQPRRGLVGAAAALVQVEQPPRGVHAQQRIEAGVGGDAEQRLARSERVGAHAGLQRLVGEHPAQRHARGRALGRGERLGRFGGAPLAREQQRQAARHVRALRPAHARGAQRVGDAAHVGGREPQQQRAGPRALGGSGHPRLDGHAGGLARLRAAFERHGQVARAQQRVAAGGAFAAQAVHRGGVAARGQFGQRQLGDDEPVVRHLAVEREQRVARAVGLAGLAQHRGIAQPLHARRVERRTAASWRAERCCCADWLTLGWPSGPLLPSRGMADERAALEPPLLAQAVHLPAHFG